MISNQFLKNKFQYKNYRVYSKNIKKNGKNCNSIFYYFRIYLVLEHIEASTE